MVKRQFTLRLIGLILFLAAVEAGAFFYGIHQENRGLQSLPLPTLPSLSARASLLVVAPHCDDETLGAGGLIHQATRTGARVRVVFLTNGDGFPLAVSKQYLKIRPTRNSYIRFAYYRQREATAALAELGLRKEQVTFLGYPDGGLAPIWLSHWDPERPYRSRFTGCTRSPYVNGFRRDAPYCGRAVVEDLRALIRRERPTEIVVPHPGDDHPDHWAAFCFVAVALRELMLDPITAAELRPEPGRGIGPQPRLHTYLVHRGDWPVPQGLHLEARLVPPAAMLGLDTHWSSLPLDPEALAVKQRALKRYGSQMAVMKRFLHSFVRRDELFGLVPPVAVTLTAPRLATASIAGIPTPEPMAPVITDCAKDTLIRDLNGSADLESLGAATDGRLLHLRLTARRPLSPRAGYRVHLHPLGRRDPLGPAQTLTITVTGSRCDRDGVLTSRSHCSLILDIPLSDLGHPRELLLGADTKLARVILDRLSWRVVALPEPPLLVDGSGKLFQIHLADFPR